MREEGIAKVAPLLAIVAADRAISDMAKAMSALLGERDRAAAQLDTQITTLEAAGDAVAGIGSVNCERILRSANLSTLRTRHLQIGA